ncbi:MAG: winged helix-turn-helix transcriptional regulator [Candidatus Obscuribacter sp.]|nr:winged helix-turn-helix transcriptional regulator [Candidatus Obscuribacter sp.]
MDQFDINLSLADERTPLYRRIVDAISGAIESGKLKAGDKLPTNRELASKLKIDRSTASRAYDELSSRGLIKSHVGPWHFCRVHCYKSYRTKSSVLCCHACAQWCYRLAKPLFIICF